SQRSSSRFVHLTFKYACSHHPSYSSSSMTTRPPQSTLFPYTTLFRSSRRPAGNQCDRPLPDRRRPERSAPTGSRPSAVAVFRLRSEEHTSELQSRGHLVCRLLLEKKKDNVMPNYLYMFYVHMFNKP